MAVGAWVVHSVKCPTLVFGSDHDLTAHEFEPYIGLCAHSPKLDWNSLSASFSDPALLICSLKINKLKKEIFLNRQ